MDETKVVNQTDDPVPVVVQNPAPALPFQYPMPQNQSGDWGRIWMNVGPMGVLGIIAGVASMFVMGLLMFTIKTGQEAMQKSQDQIYQQLNIEKERFNSEKDASRNREDRLLDRADRLAKDQQDRWEKSREKNEELRTRVESLATKSDVMLTKMAAIEIFLKLSSKEKP